MSHRRNQPKLISASNSYKPHPNTDYPEQIRTKPKCVIRMALHVDLGKT